VRSKTGDPLSPLQFGIVMEAFESNDVNRYENEKKISWVEKTLLV
jgi:hypothetical protein